MRFEIFPFKAVMLEILFKEDVTDQFFKNLCLKRDQQPYPPPLPPQIGVHVRYGFTQMLISNKYRLLCEKCSLFVYLFILPLTLLPLLFLLFVIKQLHMGSFHSHKLD